MTLLTVNDLTKKYANKTAVDHVSFSCDSGSCIALLGPNGAGKTSILRMLGGLMKPTSGKMELVGDMNSKDYRTAIGYLPQYPKFHEWMTGKEFLVYCGRLCHFSKQRAGKMAAVMLEKVGLAEAASKRIGGYSGGMKQRLGIAQAMIHKPKLLLLDEPVSSLDPIGRREVMTLLETLKKEMTILFSTHILGDADEICDALLLLRQGSIVESGSIAQLRQKYKTEMIGLEFDVNAETYQIKLRALPSVLKVVQQHNRISVSTSNQSQARQEILAAAAEEGWPISRFEFISASLEDMFMKVVDG